MSITDQILSLEKKLLRLRAIRKNIEEKKRLARRHKKFMLQEREKQKVWHLRSQGKSHQQIMEKCGISEYRVERICRLFSEQVGNQSGLSRNGEITADSSLNNLTLTVRCANCLNNANIITVGQLCEMTPQDLMHLHNFGRFSLYDLRTELAKHGLRLKHDY